MSERLQRALLALGLFVLSATAVIVAQRDQGIARDEGVYMSHGSRYANWWVDMVGGKDAMTSEEVISRHFGGAAATAGNREHPPLMKTLFGLSERLFHDKLKWAGETTAYRIPSALINALLVVLVFLFVVPLWGTGPGLIAALLVLFLPRAFFHAGLATFDASIVTFWFATLVAYLKSLQSRWGFLWLSLCVGLALATKHNAILLPAVLLPHYFWLLWCQQPLEGSRAQRLWAAFLGSRPQTLLGLFVGGPLILILLWPWMWFDTLTHVREWIGFHLNHVHYNFEYLGQNWNAPPFPWHIAIVTTLFTVPAATLLAACTGLGVAIARWAKGEAGEVERSSVLLIILSSCVAMGPFLLRTTPIFGAEKHWAPAIPTLCILAGISTSWLADRAAAGIKANRRAWRPAWLQPAIVGFLGLCVVGAAFVETRHAHPYSLSHYNALAGGAEGGASMGMNRQFWGYSARGVLPFVNQFAEAGKNVPVYSHDASPSWNRYRSEGLLLPGLPDSGRELRGIRKSKVAIVIHEMHFRRHDYMIWEAYKKVQPSFVLLFDGVPLVSVYVRDELATQ